MPWQRAPQPSEQHPFALAFARRPGARRRIDLETGVAVAVFDLGAWRPLLEGIEALVGAEAAARATRQRIPGNRDALLATYALQRLWIAELLGLPPARVELARDERGRPCLADARLHTSLSHAGERAALALTATGPVGVDLEPADRARDMPELEERVAHPLERRALPAAADARGHALLRLWVRKEALLKAAGIGLELEMDRFQAPEGVALSLPGPVFGGRAVRLQALDGGRGWVLALASVPDAAPCLLEPLADR